MLMLQALARIRRGGVTCGYTWDVVNVNVRKGRYVLKIVNGGIVTLVSSTLGVAPHDRKISMIEMRGSFSNEGSLEHDDVRQAARHDQRGRDVAHRALHFAPDGPVLLHDLLELRVVTLDREPARAPRQHEQPAVLLDGRLRDLERLLDDVVQRSRGRHFEELHARKGRGERRVGWAAVAHPGDVVRCLRLEAGLRRRVAV